MTTIYAYICGRWHRDFVVEAIALHEGEWTRVGQHVSSNESFAKSDIGATSQRKHDQYREVFPDGFAVEWVDAPASHPVIGHLFAPEEPTQYA